jgi:hypothetical protein
VTSHARILWSFSGNALTVSDRGRIIAYPLRPFTARTCIGPLASTTAPPVPATAYTVGHSVGTWQVFGFEETAEQSQARPALGRLAEIPSG